MGLIVFLRGFVVGFLAAAPIGPVNVLCIQRTLSRGKVMGIVSGLGAATVDACYGGIAGLGLTFVSDILTRQGIWFRVSGGLFAFLLGVRTIFATPGPIYRADNVRGFPGAYISTFLLTLANPTTIFSYGLLFACLGGMSIPHRDLNAGLLMVGVFLGSALWWVILSSFTDMLRHRLQGFRMKWINYIAGIIVAGFGLYMLLRPL